MWKLAGGAIGGSWGDRTGLGGVSENLTLLGFSVNRDNLVYLELIVLFFTLFFLFLLARLLVLLLFVLLFSATRDGSEH
jgi:hypothetical protein